VACHRGALVPVVERDQNVTCLYPLSFVDGNAADALCDHRADRHAQRRHYSTARHDGLHDLAALDFVHGDGSAENQVAEDKAQGADRDQRQSAAPQPRAAE